MTATPDEDDLSRLRHDLRSPLAVIAGFADVIANRDGITAEERREFAARITDAVEEIRGLVREL